MHGLRRDRSGVDDERDGTAAKPQLILVPDRKHLLAIDEGLDLRAMQPHFLGVGSVELPGEVSLRQYCLVVIAFDEFNATAIDGVKHQCIITFAPLSTRT